MELRSGNRERKNELRQRYNEKLSHLEIIRNRELDEKGNTIPDEIEAVKACKVFDKGKFDAIKTQELKATALNNLELEKDEKLILNLNPKFSVLRKLCMESGERDIENGLAKIRYEIHIHETGK